MPGSDKDLLNQQKQQIQDMINEQIANKPRPEDFKDTTGAVSQLDYQSALQSWGQDYRQAVELLQGLTNTSMDVASLPDGTIVPMGDLSPEEQAYVKQYNDSLYNQLLAKYGLDQYSVARQSAQDENQRRIDEYNAKTDELKNKMAVDQTGLDRALASLERWMNGQQVAGQEADRIQEAQKQAVQYGTANGKTSFSGRDLGGGVSMLAQQGGIGMDAPLLQYPGFQTMDPAGDRQAALAGMGVSNMAPDIPMPTIGMGDVPSLGSLGAVPSGGGSMPMPMPPPNLPSWKPNLGPAQGAVQGGANSVAGYSGVAGNAWPAIQSGASPQSNFLSKLLAGAQSAGQQVLSQGGPLNLGIR